MRFLLGPAKCRRDFSLDGLGRGPWFGVAHARRIPAERPVLAHRCAPGQALRDGRAVPEVPAVPADPVGALRARHDAQGLRLDARTTRPTWLGERLDVGWAIDVLHPLAR
jgi:hypothetical protein